MLRDTTRSGAPSPVRGMNRLDPQHSSANTIISPANDAGSPPSFAASPPTMVPSRIAMKVAPSTSALPAGNSRAGEMVRQDAVLDRAEQRADHAEAEQRDEQDRHRMRDEAGDGDQRDADLGELEPLRHQRLVVAVGQLAAEPGQEEVRRDEHRRGERDQRFRRAAPDLEQDQEHQRVLEKIVAERREELAPEQRREAPGQQEGFGIGLGRGHGPHFMPMDCDGRQSRAPDGGDIPSFATDSGRTPGKRPLDGRKDHANQGISGRAWPWL